MRALISVLLISLTISLYLLESMASRGLSPTVIVIGAGMSGISAAKTLSEAGIKDILILEATHRIGGRIKKTKFSGVFVEMGANWVEGVNGKEVNPIWTMANEIGLKSYRSELRNIASNVYKQSGGLYNESEAQKVVDSAEEFFNFSANVSVSLLRNGVEDISILTAERLRHKVPSTPIEKALEYFRYDSQQGEPPRLTSLRNTAPLPTFADFGDDIYFVADSRGYESVVHYVAKEFLTTNKAGEIKDPRLMLNKVVTEIHYSGKGIIVKSEDGGVYKAEYVMVSTSIGVLQTDLISFVPPLPDWKLLALDQFDLSVYTKIFIKFPYKFWSTGNGTEFFVYAHERRGYYTNWQQLENEYPGANLLLVTLTDDESRRIEQQSDSKTKSEIMEVLRNMFGDDIPEATDILVPRWWSDRFYKGCFSNWPVGLTRHRFNQIKSPVDRVYFTGEHTSEKYFGYVHGAYLAGIDSANSLINCVKKKVCNPKDDQVFQDENVPVREEQRMVATY
ncbi:hypothetical protein MKW98_030160 [Papaver atlanticum]|uniref:Amine oxidase domain-containing protein n=1 Tax=Papaver atlanticum TaxID=357466 RepID=A0AAD4XK35_9MAGN|nr:hypothetical protein MKW98_030160 [Papaver atlanticum]